MTCSVVVQTEQIFGRLVGSLTLLIPLIDVVPEVQLLLLANNSYLPRYTANSPYYVVLLVLAGSISVGIEIAVCFEYVSTNPVSCNGYSR